MSKIKKAKLQECRFDGRFFTDFRRRSSGESNGGKEPVRESVNLAGASAVACRGSGESTGGKKCNHGGKFEI